MVTVQEAARILGISPDTIRQWEKKQLIKSKRTSDRRKIFELEELKRIHNNFLGNPSKSGEFKVLTRPSTAYTAIELFSGCGGMALGFENAGLQTQLLVECDRDCTQTLRLNRPQWNVIHEDIAQVNLNEYQHKIDIVAGGFPCQAFSYAGLGKGFADVRGTLFFEFARCVDEVRPKIAIAENVRGLLKHDSGRTLTTMLGVLDELGYRIDYKLLRAQFLDVPQKRERLFLIGVRKDYPIQPIFPQEKDYTISLRAALKDCPPSVGTTYPEHKKKVLELVPPGGYWRDLPLEVQKAYMQKSFYLGGGKTGMARRLSWEEPSLTLTCSPAQKQTERCHPQETRPLNIREYARIQTFPDDWQFVGSIASQYRQIGNAVPVNLAYHIGCGAIAILEGKIDRIDRRDRNCREAIASDA
ncbi:DNA (cytosine-5-)-methyltransferase [Oxynema sp. CENA135]|uniref:DNA (cytosine-5-)-methyltransferase n=1 Tax=Oxynema sp. CENA135 TaxID=984206 RepID=UPI001909A1C7|nr:DNA (cytosine-5-)-methyltransferase [Oxynema sp. CENA135]MBK4728593.1 DNA (cytosine-5-)-methyltransferase [Oxynema sp. CENA135]